jgi:hypothetical protein
MDAVNLAARLDLSHMSNVIAGTTGAGNDVRVWLRNGYGIAIKMSQSSVLCVMPVRFAEPFDPDWSDEPKFEFIRRATLPNPHPADPGHPLNHVQGADVHAAIAVLSRLYELDRAQPLKTR